MIAFCRFWAGCVWLVVGFIYWGHGQHAKHPEQFHKTSNPYPIPFEHVWKILGYASKQMAKNALYQEFNEGEDFINFNNDIEVSRENAGSRGPIEEMLRLSWECFVHFTHNAQTRTARLISKKIVKEYFQTIKRLDQENKVKDISRSKTH